VNKNIANSEFAWNQAPATQLATFMMAFHPPSHYDHGPPINRPVLMGPHVVDTGAPGA